MLYRLFAASVTFLSRRRYVDNLRVWRQENRKIPRARVCARVRITGFDKERNFLPTKREELESPRFDRDYTQRGLDTR